MSTKTAFPEFRAKSGKSVDEIAALFKCNRATIYRWENGTTPIPPERLDEFEKITGISRQRLRPDIFGVAA